ncbi:hypothetical protein [Haloferula sargassicola]|uniref:hypothetical protein n=1 Tax=Haloferula sargassicola TaxID=490096 RepID=UPI0033658A44
MAAASLCRAEEEAKFHWKAPEIGAGEFSDALGMLAREREDYAENLAGYAVNLIARHKASDDSLRRARRFVALSMQLAPRNRRALVANYQLSHGIVPAPVENSYDPEVLAKLLFTRAALLKQQGGPENLLLARAFIELAAELDPRNDDAVYASELQRLDHGGVDWDKLAGGGGGQAGGE